MSIAYDFKSIRAGMKGELKAQPKMNCLACHDGGWLYDVKTDELLSCSICGNPMGKEKPC